MAWHDACWHTIKWNFSNYYFHWMHITAYHARERSPFDICIGGRMKPLHMIKGGKQNINRPISMSMFCRCKYLAWSKKRKITIKKSQARVTCDMKETHLLRIKYTDVSKISEDLRPKPKWVRRQSVHKYNNKPFSFVGTKNIRVICGEQIKASPWQQQNWNKDDAP